MPAAPNRPSKKPSATPELSRAALAELAETLGRHVVSDLEERLQDLLAERLSQPGPPPLLDVSDVAERLKVSARTVERIVNSGQLRPIWIEGQRRFTLAAVEAYLKAAAKRGKR